MKKALLTGASGFLGEYLLHALEQQGYEVTTLGRQKVNGRSFIAKNLGEYDKEWHLEERYDLLVHAAGKAHVNPSSNSEKQAFWNLNYQGTKNLLDAFARSRALPKQLVFISTVSVYGLESGRDIDENTPLQATDPYGASKRKAEDYVKWWGTENEVNWLILRLPLVAGQNPPGNLGSILNGIKKGMYFGIGKGDARKSMVLAQDVAGLAARVKNAQGIYHLTDGVHPTFRALEQAIEATTGKKVPLNLPKPIARILGFIGDVGQLIIRKKLPFNSALYRKMTQSLTFSDQKARSELDWQPNTVLDYWPNEQEASSTS